MIDRHAKTQKSFPIQWKFFFFSLFVILVALVFFVPYQRGALFKATPPGQNIQAQSPSTSFSFTAGGDIGANSNSSATLDLLAKSGGQFHLAIGDLSYSEITPEQAWCSYVQSHVGNNFPFELLAGNHEDGGEFQDGLIDTFAQCLPDRLGAVGTYGKEYYFDYPASSPLARFILISPDLTFTNGGWYSYAAGTAHYNWVANTIDSARAAGIKWVIVGMHKVCISIGDEPCEIGNDILNLLISKKVDLILQGHDHDYQRSKQLALNSTTCTALQAETYNSNCVVNDGSTGSYTKGLGPVVDIIGTVGEGLSTLNLSDGDAGYFAKWMGNNINPTNGLTKFTLSSDHLTVSANFMGSTAPNNFTDSFTISGPASAPSPSLPAGPVNKTWYFAEGRVGKGFKEYVTLGNPLSTPCSVNVEYMLAPDSGRPSTKTVPVTVPGGSRVTQYVNTDLSVAQSQATGVSVSALVQVNTTATPNCTGIVAERPMYFNALGVNSGDDVMGATHAASTFYFADVPTGGGYSSFLTILNPGNSPATVTATYYAGGSQVGTQMTTVAPNARGTISPNNRGLPAHVAAVVSSTQPIVMERPDYFSHINGGNAGTVSGAAVVVGTSALANDWLLAEGYTGTHYQEKLVMANLDSGANTSANVTIKLDFATGGARTFQLSLAKLSQVIWNVNTAVGPNQAVSAEVLATGANIVVEREMFFQSSFTVNGVSSMAMGGSEVNGQVGPASHSSYSFAEGYTNTGYKEWLTLQNPTANAETIYVTLVNGYGRTYTQAFNASANSRTTVDINSLVVAHLLQSGDKYPGYEVSMTVQTLNGTTFMAERPMYWNASGTQGGSVTIGYIGG